jgi:hypothetical protein
MLRQRPKQGAFCMGTQALESASRATQCTRFGERMASI